MKYLKVFTDFAEDIEELGDAEIGRLFRAMLSYAETGIAPELKGNERFVWGTARKNIDKQRESYEERCAVNKRIATNRYETLRNGTLKHEPCEEKEKDKEKDKEKKKKDITREPRFIPPTLEEVTAYVMERNSPVDPQYFIDFYTAKNWMVGRNKMKDWKAACRNAEAWDRWNKTDVNPFAPAGGRLDWIDEL